MSASTSNTKPKTSKKKSQTKHPNTSVAIAAREAKAVALFLGETTTLQEIADEMGYTDASTARHTILRALRKQLAPDANEVASKVAGRTNAMISSLWPVAMGDLDLIPQWIGKGKNRRPVTDPDGKQYVYVIPSLAKLSAISECQKLDKTLRDMYGTDFQHGLDERKQKLEEERKREAIEIIKGFMAEIGLTDEQQARVPEIMGKTMRELQLIQGGKTA